VDYLRDFIITFSSLSLGNHSFDLEFNDKFFGEFEYSEIKKGKGTIQIELEKKERMLVFDIMIDGWVEVTCDRCLEPFEYDIYTEERLFVKFGEAYEEQSEDVIIIPEGSFEYDLSQFIYELINLSLPIKIVHPDDEDGNSLCDPDIIERLESLKPKTETDPRWDSLKGLADHIEEN
jgi:uncharacterized metal-binding protein YceD (DUF177 family)